MEEPRNDQIEATTPANTEATPPPVEEVSLSGGGAQGIAVAQAFEASLAPSADPPVGLEILGSAIEQVARKAYAKLAEELKHKGDFPEWEAVSERGRGAYLDAVDHVQRAIAAAKAAETLIKHELAAFEKACDEKIETARVSAKPRTRFEEIVLEILSE